MQEVRLIILGDGNERHELEQLAEQLEIANDVCFAGFVDNPYKYMSKSSLFVLSSNYEGIANVLIEALACGCPVVSTDCPSGPHEVLEGGKWGRLVPVGDEEALAEAMQEALSEPHDPDRLRQRAMDFTVDKAVDNYLNVLFPSA
jgi:glycosyltransferase involved in cell wall biosynthesis